MESQLGLKIVVSELILYLCTYRCITYLWYFHVSYVLEFISCELGSYA